MPALAVADAKSPQRLELALGLDPFGKDRRPGLGRERDEGGRERTLRDVGVDVAGERDVELDDVRVEQKDVAETREPGPRVVDGEPAAGRPEGREGGDEGASDDGGTDGRPDRAHLEALAQADLGRLAEPDIRRPVRLGIEPRQGLVPDGPVRHGLFMAWPSDAPNSESLQLAVRRSQIGGKEAHDAKGCPRRP